MSTDMTIQTLQKIDRFVHLEFIFKPKKILNYSLILSAYCVFSKVELEINFPSIKTFIKITTYIASAKFHLFE